MSASTSETVSEISAALARLRGGMAEAARAARRQPDEIVLVAVSKTHPGEAVLAAIRAGQSCFGENRVQEAAAKFGPLRANHPDLRLHLIGGLQTNKAGEAVRIADVIESLDRPKLADAIEAAAQLHGRLPKLLVQVNIGDEPQKSGISTADADGFIQHCQTRFGDALAGLMCIPPGGQDPRPYFRALATLRQRHGLRVLSMGMSADYAAAIAEGATHIRVGSAIFGTRAVQA